MDNDKARSLLRYQTGVLTALTGILVGRGLATRHEVSAALDIVAQLEADQTARAMLTITRDCMASDGAPNQDSEARRALLEVLPGGKL